MPPTKKLCMVCGDKALGYNFNAVTCESCKAFFRRNALSNKTFTCPFNENCEVTVITRRFCQKCRLEKCFKIGMKKEHIMSEQDKMLKKKKIEQNRAKRKLLTTKNKDDAKNKIKREIITSTIKTTTTITSSPSNDHVNCDEELWSTDKIKRNYSDTSERESPCDFSNTSFSCESYKIDEVLINNNEDDANKNCPYIVCSTSNAKDIVNSIVNKPDTASQIINHIMKTPKDAVDVITKIINSPTEALRFISHLVLYPGDALKIISKIMNSPLDALTVFTKFMSSPNDSLQIISRIVNSPADVLQFIQQLMRSPEDASNIMEKFMNTPAEALKIINNMVNNSSTSNINKNDDNVEIINEIDNENTIANSMIDSMLNEIQSPESSLPSSPGVNGTVVQKINSKYPNVSVVTPSTSSTLIQNNYNIDNEKSICDAKPSPSPPPSSSSLAQNFVDITDITFNSLITGKSDKMKNILEDVEDRPIQPNSIESVLCEAIKLEYETYSSLPQSVGDSKELTEAEKAKLSELIQASKALYYPVDEDLSNIINDEKIKYEGSQHDPKLLHVINLTAVAIRRLIKMSKKINAFRNMCQEDQVALLKGGCTEMMIMRSVMTYDHNKATWKIPHSKEDMSNIRVEILKLAKGNVYEEHERFIRTFDPKWRMDENIILIMCAILLFSPTRPRVIHSDVIKLEQNSYYYLLRRYLESVFPGCEAKSTFIKLIQKISDATKLNEVFINVYLNINPSHIEPLLREIFDMKNH